MSGIREAEAKKHLNSHKERFPKVWGWIAATKKGAKRQRPPHVRTLYGRVRRLPTIYSSDENMRAKAERQAVNTKIQGSAADLIKRAMVRIHDTLDPDMFLVLQVHDELVVITPRSKAEQCAAIMKEAMEGPDMQVLRVPITANIKIVDSWDAAK
jgi:DNA polymerase-1